MTAVFQERNFEKVGGLQEHIQTLKEMIIYPLLYRELFDSYGIQAPRGVLFYGPPGTGKTLMAGAVAAECSKCCSRKVSFYMRKGGECLNKYVGESEKHLQNLFNQAYNTKPSIIFFDEIDGLVPTRSEYQEQVHASVVSTLLALMDGLDTKSEVFVIGATNRIDMIDPALRRPGRFDRELYFPLPSLESRLEIFKIHTSNWRHKPSENLMLKLAAECSGYCGADIQSLCSQAVMQSFNRSFPQVLDTTRKQHINFKNIFVRDEDFWEAKEKIVPASQRIYILPSRPLTSELEPLLKRSLDEAIKQITKFCPFHFMYRNSLEFPKNKSLSCPRFLLVGNEGQAHISHIAPAVLHFFDHLPVVVMDLTTISDDGNRNSDSSSLAHRVEEARQSMPSIIYLRNVTSWWNLIDDTAKQVLISSLEGLDASNSSKIFIFGSASIGSYEELPTDIRNIFPKKKCFQLTEPYPDERKNFFRQVLVERNLLPPRSHEGENLTHVELIECSQEEPELSVHTFVKVPTNLSIIGMNSPSLRKPSKLEIENSDFVNNEKTAGGRKRKLYTNQSDPEKPDINNKSKLQDLIKNLDSPKSGRLRSGKPFRQPQDDINISKRPKLEVFSSPSCSTNDLNSRRSNTSIVIVDVSKLEQLTDIAVKVTASARVNTLVRLYEELEIVSLRYSSKLDRSLLPEELEREISIFSPT